MEKGLIHIYTGDGKGKTTASVGLAVRARGRGMKVLFSQFMKAVNGGEIAMLEKLQVRILSFKEVLSPYFHPGADLGALRAKAIGALEQLAVIMPGYDLVIMDEFMHLIKHGLVTQEEALVFLGRKPAGVELVLTGRDAPLSLIEAADYVTEMRAVKHPLDKGLKARAGIEF